MGIALGGLASGMDTTSLITQLMEAQKQPVYQKQNEINSAKEKKDVWQQLNTKISSLQSAVTDLKLSATFSSKKVTSSDEAKASATATNNAANTSYVLEKVTLATPAKVTGETLTLADGTAANTSTTSSITEQNKRFNTGTGVVAGNFKINGKTISVAANDTVNLVISKINAANTGVKASYDSDTKKFKLTTTDSSTSKFIELDKTDTSGFLSKMGLKSQLGQKIANGVNADENRVFQDVASLSEIKSGFFTINGTTLEVDKAKDTLQGVISKINASSAGVMAFFDSDTNKVTFTSKETGKDLVLENDTSNFFGVVGLMNKTSDSESANDKSTYKGSDAKMTINGVDFTKTSNKFVLNGVNFELKTSLAAGEKVTVQVNQDTDKAATKIKSFVDKYNDVMDFLETNTKITTTDGKASSAGAMQGDSMASSMMFSLRQKIMTSVEGITGSTYYTASSVGITAKDSRSSKLTLDSTKLNAALADDPDAVKRLFTQSMGAVSVSNESVGTGDGKVKKFTLDKIPSSTTDMTITVGTTTYSGSKLITTGTPKADEVLINLSTGDMTFGTTPVKNKEISASYSYDSSKGNEDGIAARMATYLKPLTIYNGSISNHIKSFQTKIDNTNKWISKENDRLTLREESLRKQFSAMESAMQNSSSQGQWLSSQLSNISA